MFFIQTTPIVVSCNSSLTTMGGCLKLLPFWGPGVGEKNVEKIYDLFMEYGWVVHPINIGVSSVW